MYFTLLIITFLVQNLVLSKKFRDEFPVANSKAVLDDCLEWTNVVRVQHSSPKIKYTKEANEYAIERAKYMSTGEKLSLKHQGLKDDFGENIYRAVGGEKVQACKNAIKNWYSEIKFYDFAAGLFVPSAGHFTQLIWAGTKEMGCARVMKSVDAAKKRFEIYIVCVYREPGNVKGEYLTNVKPVIKKKIKSFASFGDDENTTDPFGEDTTSKTTIETTIQTTGKPKVKTTTEPKTKTTTKPKTKTTVKTTTKLITKTTVIPTIKTTAKIKPKTTAIPTKKSAKTTKKAVVEVDGDKLLKAEGPDSDNNTDSISTTVSEDITVTPCTTVDESTTLPEDNTTVTKSTTVLKDTTLTESTSLTEDTTESGSTIESINT